MSSSNKLRQLMLDVEELLAELSDEHSTEVLELRDRVEASLHSTKRAFSTRRGEVAAHVGQLANSLDSYVTHYPRLAFVSGAIAAGLLGYLAGLSAVRK